MTTAKGWPQDPPPVVIVGPTATGKTAVAVELAERIGGEIINADSMQVYRFMDVGTAKPTPAERDRVPFHLLDVVTPDEPFNASRWKELALIAVADIAGRGKYPILCGGTGMYVRALLDGWTLAATPADLEVRAALTTEVAQIGSPALHQRLQEIDPRAAARLHPNDTLRIVRALEVYQVSGKPITEWQDVDRIVSERLPALRFGLDGPRPWLFSRVEDRVDAMVAAGLLDEVRDLLARGYSPDLPPLGSLGYKEVIAFLEGHADLPATIEKIKQNTRRFAKRQLTWFRADAQIEWLDASARSSAENAEEIRRKLSC